MLTQIRQLYNLITIRKPHPASLAPSSVERVGPAQRRNKSQTSFLAHGALVPQLSRPVLTAQASGFKWQGLPCPTSSRETPMGAKLPQAACPLSRKMADGPIPCCGPCSWQLSAISAPISRGSLSFMTSVKGPRPRLQVGCGAACRRYRITYLFLMSSAHSSHG